MQGDKIELPPTADFYVHLRDGKMMETVTPLIRAGGVDTVRNLQPPITTVEQALSYQDRLQALAPNVTFLMSLYLHSSITPEPIFEAKKAGITGVKVWLLLSSSVTKMAANVFRFEREVVNAGNRGDGFTPGMRI